MTKSDYLRRNQNSDGGWGYFPGKQSWVEPTVYAALALHGQPEADRAWALLKTWQNPDGSWRPSAEVPLSTWATALCVTVAAARGDSRQELEPGAKWLLSAGSSGWAWMPGSPSAAEPTAHSMIALRKAAAQVALPDAQVKQRLAAGENHLLGDGSSDSLTFQMLAIPGRMTLADARSALNSAPPLRRAWTALALRIQGQTFDEVQAPVSNDLMLTSLQALAAP